MMKETKNRACMLAAMIIVTAVCGADLAEWRLATAANGHFAVKGRAKVPQDVRQGIWKAYREHVGIEGIQMSRPTLLATNEYGAVYDLSFTTSEGMQQNFGVRVTKGNTWPLYVTGAGLPPRAPSDAELKEHLTRRFLLDIKDGSRIASPGRVLSASVAKVSLGFEDEVINAPFDEFLFFFIDDYPLANWGHPARCVFARPDLSEFAVLYVNMPARVKIDGEAVAMSPIGNDMSNADKAGGGTKARSVAKLMVSGAKAVFPAVADGDASSCYALIVSGGGDESSNHGRYWNDVCFAYNVLRKRYKLPRENIKVLWASGNPDKDLCWKYHKCENTNNKWDCSQWGFYDSNLSDFDEDGNSDITGAATLENLVSVFRNYSSSLKATDQLFVFVTDHGSKNIPNADWNEPAAICLWNRYGITDVQFAEITKDIKCPVMFALETCYSGGMRQEIIDSNKNRVIATADAYDSSTSGNVSFDIWAYNFLSALCGYYPKGYYPKVRNTKEENDEWLSATIDVRAVGDVCNADRDGDGRVSFYEAAMFARDNNPRTAANGSVGQGIDDPKYTVGTANLGKKLFMTQYADAPTVVVKEKVLTPTLSPASGALGYAPCTVTASCGTSGATIRYTTDGSTPTGKSTVYSGGIVISGDTTVTIRAFKSGMDASDTAQIAYTVKKTSPEKALVVSVSQGDSSSGIVICWSGGSGTDSYDILRGESSDMVGASVIKSGLSASVSSWADMTASPGKTYYYQIRSRNAYGTTLSAVSQGAYLMLNPPDGVTATVTATRVSTATVKLSWNAAAGASYYRVYRTSADGTLAALGTWQTARTYTDTVPLSGLVSTFSYYIKASASSSDANASAYSRETQISITSTSDGWSLILCTPWWSTEDVGDVFVQPGGHEQFSCRLMYADGTFEESGFVNSPLWSVKEGLGITLSSANGSFSSFASMASYRAPTVDINVASGAPRQIAKLTATVTLATGVSVSQDFRLIVSGTPIVKGLRISGPDFAVPGETLQLHAEGNMYGESSWVYDDLDEDTEVRWTVIGGGGATLSDDGELTAWPVSSRTNIVVQASVQTLLGMVTATKTFSVSPSVITKQTAVIPPLGGESTNLVGMLTTSTYCECYSTAWISGLGYHGSKTTNPADSTIHINLGYGKSSVGIIGSYLFMSFRAARNPGKDREMPFKLRWDGGGIDFTILQKEAPYANDPVVNGGANGTITANSTTDGSVLHYATDGEEPSESSPVLSNSVSFNDSTEFAVKAFGDWMQASETVYADVVGKDAQWDEIEISFVPGQPGLAVPQKRTYKVNEAFGVLPSFQKTNGLYFKGWTLHEGSEKLVLATDSIPNLDSTLYAVWSPVEEDRPDWTALPWDFRSAMTATMKVYDDTTGTYLDPSICIIGIEDANGVSRGSSENGFGDMQSELNGKNGLYVFGIYSQIENGQETGLRIRVWNRQKGFMTVLDEELTFSPNNAMGNELQPFVVHVTTGFLVEFDANGGSVDEAFRRVAEGAEVGDLPILNRKGYAFVGWWTERDKGTKVDATTKIFNDVTFYARWTAAWTVTLNANGGLLNGAEDEVSVPKNTAVGDLPVPVRTNYAFLGWFTAEMGGTKVSSATKVSADVTYHAHWRYVGTADDATIVFETDDSYVTEPNGALSINLSEFVGSTSAPKLAVKGLPTGLKFDAKAGVISGKATKPGVYVVTVSATNATVKKPVTATFDIVVPNLTCTALSNLDPATDAYGTIRCGVAFNPEWVDCTPEKGWTVKVAGLPAGLKYDAKTGKITGVPTKAGTFTVTFTASKKGEMSQMATITLETAALPEWAVGTFWGDVERKIGDGALGENSYGSATMTVATNGKISGKIALDGTNWTFVAASYAASDGGDHFEVVADAKAGKATMPLWLLVHCEEGDHPNGVLLNAAGEGWLGGSMVAPLSLWRNVWKDKATAVSAKTEIAKWEGLYTVSAEDGGYVSLVVGKDGTVKASGKLSDGTAVSASAPLLYHVCRDFFTVFCTSPATYKGGYVWHDVRFGTARGPLGGVLKVSSLNPQATGEYGVGFSRSLVFVGSYYDKAKKLNDYYGAMRLQLDSVPALQYGRKVTYFDEGGKKQSVTVADAAEAVDTRGQDGLTAAVNEKGAFVVEKATKPVQDRETKAWRYNGLNDGAMTLSFAQATGVFKGTYTLWYDYVSAEDETVEPAKMTKAHVSKKVAFEGIMVQGVDEIRGFYQWDATGAYVDPQTGKPKTYKYKESHAVSLVAP